MPRPFLDRGKHVLVEKPLTLTPEVADDLLRRSSRHGAIWYTSYNFRFEPNVVALRHHLRAGAIGRVYRVRMFYGNGTAGNLAGTWRDSRFGVLEDMASHLIDLAGFVFDRFGAEFQVWERRGYELKGVDHCILATADRSVVIECSFLSWRNRWRIEVIGERGGLEMDGLTKWGESRLTLLRRQLPSGPPEESHEVARRARPHVGGGPGALRADGPRRGNLVPERPLDLADHRGRGRRAPGGVRVTAPTGFVGLSHLGIVSSIGWASFGAPVVAVDLESAAVEALRAGTLPIHEPSLPDLFARARGHMTFSADLAGLRDCPLVIVARDVPTDDGNSSDPSVVLHLIDAAVPHLQPGATLAVMSQVPAGFTRRLAERIERQRPGLGIRLYYWVETLIFGNAVERYLEPERLIIGCADPSAPFPPELEAGLRRFHCTILPMAYESAELTKTAINLYLCAAVTYANTLADLCERLGADWTEMMPALRLDRRIGPAAYIRPGLGIAGGNLERDMVTLRDLCGAHGVDGAFIEALLGYNARRPRWVHRSARGASLRRGRAPLGRGLGAGLQEEHALDQELDGDPRDPRAGRPGRRARLRPGRGGE